MVSGADVRAVVGAVVDPELPALTIEDLGVLRDVVVEADGRVVVTITPTYSGCPAVDAIRHDVEHALTEAGYTHFAVRTVLAPAWTTNWMSDEGRRKLAEAGIAPPARVCPGSESASGTLRCPQCGSADTRLLNRFGSTACKAMRACNRCLEPFDHFKSH
ncbi:MAG: 1,2-phenylacetyl-CoA epoxidase subunit PaaD [Acidimicrobiia bacterium]